MREVELILTDRNHPQFMRALEWATERAHGKLPNKIEGEVKAVTGVILLPEVTWGAPQPPANTPQEAMSRLARIEDAARPP
jgi:hypothetical protein